jgi:hypothetical protein
VAGGNTCIALRNRGRYWGRSQINDWGIRATSLIHHSAGGPGLNSFAASVTKQIKCGKFTASRFVQSNAEDTS